MSSPIFPLASAGVNAATVVRGLALTAYLCLPGIASAQNGFITKGQEPAPFGGGAEEQRLIGDICGTQLPALGGPGCACVAKSAMTALDQPQRNYLILSVVQPQAADRTAAAKSAGDLQAIAAFIEKAGKDCAAPGGAAPAAAPDMPPPGTVTPGTVDDVPAAPQ